MNKLSFNECYDSTDCFLLEGAMGERLKREYNIIFDGHIDMGALVLDPYSRNALRELWLGYADVAQRYGMPFMATTTTRRINSERISYTRYDESLIHENVSFLKSVAEESGGTMYTGALLGCRGDAYTGQGALTESESVAFHSWEASFFAKENIDFFMAGLMPDVNETLGLSKALSDTGIPYIISFTLKKSGTLPDGTSLSDAIEIIDGSVPTPPVCYMTNCVHPDSVKEALSKDFNMTETVKKRFSGIQSNASRKGFDELDGACELHSSDPTDLADSLDMLLAFRDMKIIGGCCGTDKRHIEEMAKVLDSRRKQKK